jgi:predicted transporter
MARWTPKREAAVKTPVPPDANVGDAGRVIVIPLSPRLVFGTLVGVVLGGTAVVLVVAANVFARIAPRGEPEAMGALVAWVWLHHVVNIVRRRHTLGRGLVRAGAFTVFTALLIGAGLFLMRAWSH